MQEVRTQGPHWDPVQGNKLGPSGEVDVWGATLTRDPLRPRLRVLSPQERAHLDQAIDAWMQKGYIEPSRAWVTCNPVFVEKKNGAIRTCIDYRPINAAIDTWEWPLPKIKNIRHRLAGSSWFSRLDLEEAFHRVRVEEHSRPLTAFHTHRGNFQFTRMPFGLSTAPATFQRFIEWVLKPCQEYVISYVDDILIMASTKAQLFKRQNTIEHILRVNKVSINEAKSERMCREITFVGLQIKEHTIGTSLARQSPVLPKTKEEWWSALGYANCFRDYLPSYAAMSAGLYPGQCQLAEPERTKKWTLLWRATAQALDLQSYDDTQPGNLYLDASQYAVGAVLCQQGRACACYSKSLNQSQQRYSATDREHLALMLGLEAFRIFVQSNQLLTTNTDHTALLNRDESRMTSRQLRWKTRITEITCNIKHIPGKDNPADFWSRQGWKDGGGDKFYA